MVSATVPGNTTPKTKPEVVTLVVLRKSRRLVCVLIMVYFL
jgi:hypothetical protein